MTGGHVEQLVFSHKQPERRHSAIVRALESELLREQPCPAAGLEGIFKPLESLPRYSPSLRSTRSRPESFTSSACGRSTSPSLMTAGRLERADRPEGSYRSASSREFSSLSSARSHLPL
jgi:hypothetical protein